MKALQLTGEMATRILEELVYGELRAQVDHLLALGALERQIEDAVAAALGSLDGRVTVDRDDPPSKVLTAAFIGRAWQRIADEWCSGRITAKEVVS